MIDSARPQLYSGTDRPTTRPVVARPVAKSSSASTELISTGGTATAPLAARSRDHFFGDELASIIRQRIESRLPGRVRELAVAVTRNRVVLAGCCNTYYTKQLAQHAAMGVLEYERLTNNIEVRRAK